MMIIIIIIITNENMDKTDNLLNKDDVDYHIEDFWYGFKKSMINFYNKYKIEKEHVKLWSDKLNKLKLNKEYNFIEDSIRKYIILYALDVMKNEDYCDFEHSNILFANIKRWDKLSHKYNLCKEEKDRIVITLYYTYYCIKKKKDESLDEILELFDDIDSLILSDFVELLSLSLELEQGNVIDSIVKILGYEKTFETINIIYPNFTNKNDKNTSGFKLCKRFIKNNAINKKKD